MGGWHMKVGEEGEEVDLGMAEMGIRMEIMIKASKKDGEVLGDEVGVIEAIEAEEGAEAVEAPARTAIPNKHRQIQ